MKWGKFEQNIAEPEKFVMPTNKYALKNEIESITLEVERIEDAYFDMWDQIMEPYVKDNRAQILDKVNKNEFIKFMLSKNKTYLKMIRYLDQLTAKS